MGNKPHKRWISRATMKARIQQPDTDYDEKYIGQIMTEYHRRRTTPNTLSQDHKDYLLRHGLLERLPGCDHEYVVFTQSGAKVARRYQRRGIT